MVRTSITYINFTKKYFYQTCLIALILFSFIIRLVRLDYPFTFKWGDGSRDYLVAHHMVQYGEWPMTGPYGLLQDQGLRNSPLYFYFLAFWLKLYDNIYFLAFINISFQLATIYLIYLISKTLFGNPTAILAALFFSIIPEVISNSDYIWQPYLMQPFFYLSLYLILKSHLNQSYKLLVVGVFVLAIAAILHNSVFVFLPTILILIYLSLKKHGKKIKHLIGVLLALTVSLLLFYLPVIIYLMRSQATKSNAQASVYAISLHQYLYFVQDNLAKLLHALFSDGLFSHSISLEKILAFIITLVFLWYVLAIKDRQNKHCLLIGVLFIAQLLMAVALFNKNQLYYQTLNFGLLSILIAEIIHTTFSGKKSLTVVKVLLVLLIVKTFSWQFQFFKKSYPEINNYKLMKEIVSVIKTDLKNTQSFQIASYAQYPLIVRYPILDTSLLVPLEKDLNKKLASVSDSSPFSHIQLNKPDNVYVACYKFVPVVIPNGCLNQFLLENPKYQPKYLIYSSEALTVHLTTLNTASANAHLR